MPRFNKTSLLKEGIAGERGPKTGWREGENSNMW
jgi:hypothetical protein